MILLRLGQELYMFYKLHYGHVAADGMQQPIPTLQASRQLNSNTFITLYHIRELSQVLVFPKHDKGMELITRRYCDPAELGLLKKKHYFNDCIPLCVLINWLTNVYSLAHQFVICTFVSGFTYFFTLKKPHKNLHFWSRSGFVKEEEED